MPSTVKVTGVKEALAGLKKWQVIKTEACRLALREIGFKVEADAKAACPVDTGRLRASISTNWSGSGKSEGKIGSKAKSGDGIKQPGGPEGLCVVTGSNVEYACVIGCRQQVYEPIQGTSGEIGNYFYDTVLSKDGNPHKILKKHKFYNRNIKAVEIRTREGRRPLTITDHHLILIQRNNQIFWEEAKYISSQDYIFLKRANGAILDNSNKTEYCCPCGKTFWVHNYDLRYRKPKYCSPQCRHKYGPHDQNNGMTWTLSEEIRQKHCGPQNPQWRNGATLLRYPAEFNDQLKKLVKERDGYKCQFCNNVETLIVHHVDWDKHNNDINNLLTLCQKCHGKLNKLDCELAVININKFRPRPILDIRHYEIRQCGKTKIPYLYDFTIDDENSYVVSGVLVHNSYVEHGTQRQGAQPYLFPAYFSHEGEVEKRLSAILKKEVKVT